MICKCLFYSLIWLSLVLSPFYDFLIQTELVKLHKKKTNKQPKNKQKTIKKKMRVRVFKNRGLRQPQSASKGEWNNV